MSDDWELTPQQKLSPQEKAYGVLSDLASLPCKRPWRCGQKEPYCLTCRARDAIDCLIREGKLP